MIREKIIRHFATVILGCLLCAQTYAQQYTTKFLFVETAPDNIRQTMQTNANAVFAEINRAYDQNKSELSLSPSNVTDEALRRIKTLWATSHFYCTETSLTRRVLNLINGYEVRLIPIFQNGKASDIVIEFTKSGKINDIYSAEHQITAITEAMSVVKDVSQKLLITNFVNGIADAYNRKDIAYINDIYSEDALIIIGTVQQQTKRIEGVSLATQNGPKIEYSRKNKAEYIKTLTEIFNNPLNRYINIKFEDIVVEKHDGRPVYGVKLKQYWNSSTYNDEGYLFLLIDFRNENEMLIWVRTWQPMYSKDPKTNKMIEVKYDNKNNKIFGIEDFPF